VVGVEVLELGRGAGGGAQGEEGGGVALAEVEANTGFAFDRAPAVGTTPWPDDDAASAIETRVCEAISDVYPQFAESLALSAKALRSRRQGRSGDGRQ
jgi:hypothetical protein